MTEASFAQTFLTTVDSRPIKVQSDHVEDPRRFPARGAYILPRMPQAMSKPKSLHPGQERSVTVHLKSIRNPPLDIKLTSLPLSTSLLDVKAQITAQTRIPTDKMKVLFNKRPIQDSKVLKDVVDEGATKIELSVMVLGGVPPVASDKTEETVETGKPNGQEELESAEFWKDLKGYLMQRLKDESAAEDLSKLFKKSWETRGSKA